jgi:hypothetical protein
LIADLMLFRRMRGVFWGALVAVAIIVPCVIVFLLALTAAIKIASEQTLDEIGGPTLICLFGLELLATFAVISAALIGATAGSVDHQRGVLRDLVVAGRAPAVIAGRRTIAGVIWLLAAVLVATIGMMLLSLIAMPATGSLDVGEVLTHLVRKIPGLLATTGIAAGAALLIGSRGPAIAVYFVFSLVVDNILRVLPKVGDYWVHVSYREAAAQVQQWMGTPLLESDDPTFQLQTFENSNEVALIVFLAWPIGLLLAGLVRISRREL